MELKNVTFLLTALCIVSIIFIIAVEFYHSRSFPHRWNRPKSHLVASRYNANFKYDNDEALPLVGEKIQNQRGYLKKDSNEHFESRDSESENGVSITKKWGQWTADTSVTSMKLEWVATSKTGTKTGYGNNVKARPKKRQRLLRLKNDGGNLNEEEKLKISPYIYHEEEENKRLSIPVVEKEVKYISYFLPSAAESKKLHTFDECRYKKCAYVFDMSQADLVAFAANNLRDHKIPQFQRPPGQRWLMYTIDPAIRGFELGRSDIKSLFNDTLTYNLDSDIPFIFGRLRKKNPLPIDEYERLYDGKTKMVAWFVSHCNTPGKREDHVKRMQTVLDVDIFGECGNMTCGGGPRGPGSRAQDATTCLPMLTSTYKFYLAYENAHCLDYVTEKFFKLFQDIQIIPVVRGGFQYKRFLPSGIFIDADDFESSEKLARYLIDLGNDKQRYTEMLRRKDEWGVVKPPTRECMLCEYIHSNPPNHFYPDLQEKFGRHTCYYPDM